jgi:hypothetical protein
MAVVHFSIRRWKLQSSLIIVCALALALSGCNGSSPTEPAGDPPPPDTTPGTLTLSVIATQPSAAASGFGTSGVPDPVLTVSRARFLFREIRMHSTTGEFVEVNGSPVVVGLHLGGVPTEVATVALPIGSYDRVHVKVHRLDDADPNDQPYLTLPEYADFTVAARPSVIIEGTLDTGTGPQSFTFISDVDEEQQKAFASALQVSASQTLNITLRIDQNTWFSDGAGSVLDPNDPNNQAWISNNITNSITAFRDQDQNGFAD